MWFLCVCPVGLSLCINSSVLRKNRVIRGSRQHYTKRLLLTLPLPGSNLRQEHYIQAKLWMYIWLSQPKLTVLFGGLPEWALAYKFLAGLPTGAKQLLRASSNIDSLSLKDLIDWARTVMKDNSELRDPVIAAAQSTPSDDRPSQGPSLRSGVMCYRCDGQGHIARNCRRQLTAVRCYRCNETGHMARDCAGNGAGGKVPALTFPQSRN